MTENLILIKKDNYFFKVGNWFDIDKVLTDKDNNTNIGLFNAFISREYIESKIAIESDINKLSRLRVNVNIGPLFISKRKTISPFIYSKLNIDEDTDFDIETNGIINSIVLENYGPDKYKFRLLFFTIAKLSTDNLIDLNQIISKEVEENFIPSIKENNSIYGHLT
ncbi:hypothetical protein V6O07_05060 [Arthrospira platensis SPKY2]